MIYGIIITNSSFLTFFMSIRLFSSVFVMTLCVWLLCAPRLHAETGHQHEVEDPHSSQQNTHLHGYAELMVGLEQGALQITFTSPAANLVGFEHRARTAEEISALKQAQAILQNAKNVFTFMGGNCQLVDVQVNISALLSDIQAEHQGHQERHGTVHSDAPKSHGDAQNVTHVEHQGHQERHGGAHADGLKSSGEARNSADAEPHESHDAGPRESHNEILAEYGYQCKNGDDLTALTVHLAKLFPGIEKLKVYWLTETQQGTVDTTAQSNLVNIR